MYGLPSDFDSAVLIGIVLEQICFSENQVSFAFSDNVVITALTKFWYSVNPTYEFEEIEVPVSQTAAMSLVGSAISQVESVPEGTLILIFSSGKALKLTDDSKQYESYSLVIGNRSITV